MIIAGAFEWTIFASAVGAVLALDLIGSHGRRSTVRGAILWSAVWIGLGLGFGAWIASRFGADAGLTYLTAYVLEKSLSVDNLFIFALIFTQTGISVTLQQRALFWGVAGALVMRAVMIGLGLYVLTLFHWVVYPFAALLAAAALRMLLGEETERKLTESTCNICSSWIARFIPISPVPHGNRFLVRQKGRLMATPVFVALVAIEAADLLFAVDSIPAVFSVTRDPFLVYTSNIFALLGLRSLYFVLAGAMDRLRFLRVGLALILLFAAAKMLLAGTVEIPPLASLATIASIFVASIVASKIFSRTAEEQR